MGTKDRPSDGRPTSSRSVALALVCLVAAGVALSRLAASAFPSWKSWDAPVDCDGYAGVYGDVKTQGTICLRGRAITWAAAIERMEGAACKVDASDAGKPLTAGQKLIVSSAGGDCSIAGGRFSGAEMLALGMSIDINTADATDLEALPSIGPALAARIVEHRAANGPFQSVDDLAQVKGIGPETFKKIAGKVTAGGGRSIPVRFLDRDGFGG